MPATAPGETRGAVARAKALATLESRLTDIADSLFDAIVIKEIGPATALANKMLGDHALAADAVYLALDRAREGFGSYDGSDSPRSWVLRYVAEETALRSTMQEARHSWDDGAQSGSRPFLHSLEPETRLAVILADTLRMTDEAAATVAGVDVETFRRRLAEGRERLAKLAALETDSASDMAAD